MSDHPAKEPVRNRSFLTTQWTVIRQAQCGHEPRCREALEQLCCGYWHPVYFFIRRRGYSPEQAEDLTQGFFTELLDKNFLGQVDRNRGRFRTFLLTAVKHYLANQWDRAHALKRGGEYQTVNFDFAVAESIFAEGAPDTPDRIYLEHWASSLLNRVLLELQREFTTTGHPERFDSLKPFLAGKVPGRSYREAGESLGISEGAVKVAVHRMRRRFGQLLRAEIRRTVSTDAEVDEEIRFLFSALKP